MLSMFNRTFKVNKVNHYYWLKLATQHLESRTVKNNLLTCNMLTISTLLKKIKDVRVERKFSSKTEGVGKMMS